jgi:hypothetical protein
MSSHIAFVSMWRMLELYLHCSIRLHSEVLKELRSIGTTLCPYVYTIKEER